MEIRAVDKQNREENKKLFSDAVAPSKFSFISQTRECPQVDAHARVTLKYIYINVLFY